MPTRKTQRYVVRDPNNMHERPSSHIRNVAIPKDSKSEWVKIKNNGEIEHPDYDGDVFKDYMIVVLDKEVTNSNIERIGLAGETTTIAPGDTLTVIGFGATSEGGPGSTVLQEVDVDYVDSASCIQTYNSLGFGSDFDQDFMFCAGGTPQGGTYSCQGDSGVSLPISSVFSPYLE